MLLSFNDLRTANVISPDDDNLGHLYDIYFSTLDWSLAHLVVETGHWFSSQRVLLPPRRLAEVDLDAHCIRAPMARNDIESAPSADTFPTVSDARRDASLQSVLACQSHGLYLIGHPGAILPTALDHGFTLDSDADIEEGQGTYRSAKELRGYTLRHRDESIGAVHDLLIDTGQRTIKWLCIDTGKWLPGRLVVMAPDWISEASWANRALDVNIDRETIKGSPPLESVEELERAPANQLHDYYRFPMM